jgi:hypothetical protein
MPLNERESKGYVGVFAYSTDISIIPFKENNGIIKVNRQFSVRINLENIL